MCIILDYLSKVYKMQSKKIWIRYIEEVEVDRDLYRHVIDILSDKGFSNNEICKKLNFSRSNFYYIKAITFGVSNKTVEFVKHACEFIHRNYSSEFTFNKDKKRFEKIDTNSDKQFHNGVYYGYFKVPYTETIGHFILEVENKEVKMWSQEKNAIGCISFDKSTYCINLEATDNANNKEFLIGKNTEDIDLKCMIATWRNRQHKIYSVVCLIKHMPEPAFTKWEEIKASQLKIKQDLIKNTPANAKSVFNNEKIKFIHIDNINL